MKSGTLSPLHASHFFIVCPLPNGEHADRRGDADPALSPLGEPGELFRDFRFLAPRTRLNAFSEFSAIWGRRRLVRLVDFGEFNT